MIRCNAIFAIVLLSGVSTCHSFHSSLLPKPSRLPSTTPFGRQNHCTIRHAASDESSQDESQQELPSSSSSSSAKRSLQEKMTSWEATEDEVKAATLGGVVPGKRSDAFDVGLYIAFPLMVLSGLAFAIFPFIMGNLNVDDVGPPPTM